MHFILLIVSGVVIQDYRHQLAPCSKSADFLGANVFNCSKDRRPPQKNFITANPLSYISRLYLICSWLAVPIMNQLSAGCVAAFAITIRDATKGRVATFSFSQSGTGVWGGAPSRLASGGITPEDFRNSICDLAHFDAIWRQLFVGRRTRYICNFAIKIEPVCQLPCPHDCTVVLPLLSNERALKSGTFGVPGLVLLGRRTTRHKSGHPGKSGTGGNPNYVVTLYESAAG